MAAGIGKVQIWLGENRAVYVQRANLAAPGDGQFRINFLSN